MIDWYNVFANALWILGLAMFLAVVSMARWEAQAQGQRLLSVLERRRWQARLQLAGVLFTAGLLATASSLLERLLWGALFLWSLLDGLRTWFPAAPFRRPPGARKDCG